MHRICRLTLAAAGVVLLMLPWTPASAQKAPTGQQAEYYKLRTKLEGAQALKRLFQDKIEQTELALVDIHLRSQHRIGRSDCFPPVTAQELKTCGNIWRDYRSASNEIRTARNGYRAMLFFVLLIIEDLQQQLAQAYAGHIDAAANQAIANEVERRQALQGKPPAQSRPTRRTTRTQRRPPVVYVQPPIIWRPPSVGWRGNRGPQVLPRPGRFY